MADGAVGVGVALAKPVAAHGRQELRGKAGFGEPARAGREGQRVIAGTRLGEELEDEPQHPPFFEQQRGWEWPIVARRAAEER